MAEELEPLGLDGQYVGKQEEASGGTWVPGAALPKDEGFSLLTLA